MYYHTSAVGGFFGKAVGCHAPGAEYYNLVDSWMMGLQEGLQHVEEAVKAWHLRYRIQRLIGPSRD